MSAYLLVQASNGRVAPVAAALRRLHGVSNVEVVWGPYDVVARVPADLIDEVVEQARALEDVHRVLPCPIVQPRR